MLISIIMAGGLGKRMNSDLPKVLHEIKNKPMICYVIDRAIDINSQFILIVVGKYKEIIQNTISQYYSENILDKIKYINQPEALGTGHAIQCCIPFLSNIQNKDTHILILSGDVPLIRSETLHDFITYKANSNCLMTYELDEPMGYGRILLDNDNTVKCIIEEKDCTEEEKKINNVNCGIYYIDIETCINILPSITNKNNANEYYLTDMIQFAYQTKGFTPFILPKEKYVEIANINTVHDLEMVKSLL